MSHAVICDQCDAVLALNHADGDDEYGERSAGWIRLGIAGDAFEVCSLACAHEFLSRPELREAIEEQLVAVAEVARTIRDSREGD